MSVDQSKRVGIRIYRAADAPDLTQTDFGAKNDFGEHTELREVASELGAAARTASRLLVRQSPEEGGFSLVYLFFKPNFPLFRHRHESDCLYLVLSGEVLMGSQTLRAGDSFFVPALAPYSYTAGPDGVEVLEYPPQCRRFHRDIREQPPEPTRGGEGRDQGEHRGLGQDHRRTDAAGERQRSRPRLSWDERIGLLTWSFTCHPLALIDALELLTLSPRFAGTGSLRGRYDSRAHSARCVTHAVLVGDLVEPRLQFVVQRVLHRLQARVELFGATRTHDGSRDGPVRQHPRE